VLNRRVVGLMWLILGLLVAMLPAWGVAQMVLHGISRPGVESVVLSNVAGILLCLAAALSGFGLFKDWSWAVVGVSVLSLVLGLNACIGIWEYRVWGWSSLVVGAVVVVFAVYSFVTALRGARLTSGSS
jgi:hypothetical protein